MVTTPGVSPQDSYRGEAKWTNKQLGEKILHDLATYKLPALQQDGFRSADEVTTVLFRRSGYSAGLRVRAEADEHLHLVDVDLMLSTPAQTPDE